MPAVAGLRAAGSVTCCSLGSSGRSSCSGVGLIAFAANDRKSSAAVEPIAFQTTGTRRTASTSAARCSRRSPTFEQPNGIHTHGDGVIHIHPFVGRGGQERQAGRLPRRRRRQAHRHQAHRSATRAGRRASDQCDGKDAELVVAQWNNVETTKEKPALIRRDFGNIRFTEDGQGFTIAFVPEGTTDIPKPESAANLSTLGAADTGGATSTTLPGETTLPADPARPAADRRRAGRPQRHHGTA